MYQTIFGESINTESYWKYSAYKGHDDNTNIYG